MLQNMKKNMKKELPLFPAYWYWESAIPDYLIQCLNEESKHVVFGKGSTFSSAAEGREESKEIRDSDVMMFDPIHWFCGILFNMSLHANRNAEWNYSILGPQTLQIAHYNVGQHYDWHSDSMLLSKEEIIRKLSVICMLSDKSEYEGGVLELEGVGEMPLNKGDVLVFPSFLRHRVTPVTNGLRKTAVVWIDGYRSS